METREGLPAYEVVVVGGGAAGLSGALMLGRARRSVVVVDAGAPRNAPAAGVHGLLAREGMPPAELLEREPAAVHRVGSGFISLYTLAYISASLLFLAPLLVTLALKSTRWWESNRHRRAWRWSPGSAPCWPWWGTRSSAG